MGIPVTSNFDVSAPANVDSRLRIFSSSAEVTSSITSYRYQGMTVFVSSSTEIAEYWFKDGVADSDLILKTVSGSGGSGSSVYSSSFSGSGLTTIDDVGGINANTSIDNLEGKNFSTLFDEIFFPTVAPTAQPAGSATTAISITAGSEGSGTIREVGANVNVTLTTTYNSGSWRAGTLNSTKRSYYGPATNYYFTSGSTTEDASTTDNYTFNNHIVTYLTNTFSTAVSYSAGEIPVNSKNIGVPPSNSAGVLTPSNSTFTGIYPWFYGSSSTNITSTDVVNAIEGFYNGSPVGGSAKSITTSTGTITALYPDTSTDYYFWIAIPTQSTSKQKWFQNLNNNGNIGGPSNLFNTEIAASNVSASGYWINNYKIYISNYATRFSTGEDIGQVQLLNS